MPKFLLAICKYKKSFLILSIAALLISFSSCSNKILFQTSAVVPAAQGYVKVSTDKNKNYVINVEIKHLADVKRLTPPKQTYIVWLVSNDASTKNIGQIKTSANLNASFETVLSNKPNRIFITAEDDSNVQFFGNPIVLSTNNF